MIFPAELLTLGASTILSGVLKFIGMSLEAKRAERLHTLSVLDKDRGMRKDAREYSNTGYQWTRRIIALTVTFFVIAWPMLVAFIAPSTPIALAYTEMQPGFLFFSNDTEVTKWVNFDGGLIITPLHTHLMASIAGLYFGSSIAQGR